MFPLTMVVIEDFEDGNDWLVGENVEAVIRYLEERNPTMARVTVAQIVRAACEWGR